MKADVYVDGRLAITVVGYQHETETELWKRVKQSVVVVVPPKR
jgi:hypothetical protein